MKLLFLEPFYSGSHRAFADGFAKHSSHETEILPMPGRFWNWRLRGAAFYFARKIPSTDSFDAVIATSLLRLADFKAIVSASLPPVLLYFHESQLTYPLPPGEKRDRHLSISEISSALCADRVFFNSEFHRSCFLKAVDALIKESPDFPQAWIGEALAAKSGVLYPGCSFDRPEISITRETGEPPLILWNHRWSYDKNADDFFHAISFIKEKGIRFRLALLGEQSEFIPESFKKAEKTFKNEIVHFGYEPSGEKYIDWLRKADIVVSTANQENFGIAVVEAIRYGTIPMLPARLSYPELLPEKFHTSFLYKSRKEMIDRLIEMLETPGQYLEKTRSLAGYMDRFSWEKMIKDYDAELTDLKYSP